MMWPRKRLDISWKDLFAAVWACAISSDPKTRQNLGVDSWSTSPRPFSTLSVRSGLHLLLGAVNWPLGSEVLMSAMTIPDMARIVRHHGYVPVPIDLDIDTAAPTLEALERATTSLTRGLIVAHLFGGRIPLNDILSFADSREIDVLEDCAQAFVGPTWSGHDGCLASFFQFWNHQDGDRLRGCSNISSRPTAFG
jgi:dTDP-4-amino-4,6-dideoxygalactose transaminase